VSEEREFDWNNAEAAHSRQKHDLSLREAATAFSDAHAVIGFDARRSDGEERWLPLGRSASGRLVVVGCAE
jgi:uncharacterized DUF497 family protein